MNKREEVKQQLIAAIETALLAYPDLAGEASSAISSGVYKAFSNSIEKESKTRLALAVSLALLPPKRITENTKKILEDLIISVLDRKNATESEKEFIATRENK